jgi:sugar lactone lactonase YvrE
MKETRQAQWEQQIAQLIRQTPGEWREIRVHVCGNAVTLDASITADVPLPRPTPAEVSWKLVDLRESMADPRRRAWLMLDIFVPRIGKATFSYDWMTKPDWEAVSGVFDDALYLEDLKKFPRTPENVPDWYPNPDTVSPIAAAAEVDEVIPPPPPRPGPGPDVPLTGLKWPFGVAIDSSGSLYVSDTANDRVVTLAAGTAEPVVLPFSGLREPAGVAVDAAGTVYFADSLNNRVLTLAAGASSATEAPLNGLNYPGGVAVDDVGSVYVVDRGNGRVLKLAAGATNPTVLPFSGLGQPIDVAVDAAGAVYVTDRPRYTTDPTDTTGNRVLKLAAGDVGATELPMTGARSPFGVTVDTAGTVYVTDGGENGRVLKLFAGTTSPVVTSSIGLHEPAGVAVDAAGSIYVTDMPPAVDDDQSCGRVVKLAAEAAIRPTDHHLDDS